VTEQPLSWALQEAVVQVCGTAFWWKEPLRKLFVRAGVPGPLVNRYDSESKFKMARYILADLDGFGDRGVAIQRQVVRELSAIRLITDLSVDREAAARAIAELRTIAKAEGLPEVDKPTADVEQQRKARLDAIETQRVELARLCDMYRTLATRADEAQARGYDLEVLIGDLFKLYGIAYTPPYRKGTVEQTDGFFAFDGFHYLIECRWRGAPPPIGELRSFSGKVAAKVESTRGLFLSVAGFRDEVLREAQTLRNLIYMDGQDLALVLEGRPHLPEALQVKSDQAAQRGVFFHPLQTG
jgi:Restriction endonuclease